MFITGVARKASISGRLAPLSLLCLMVLILLSACMDGSSAATKTTSKAVMSDGFSIQVSAKPDIIVKSENAAQLTFVGSDAQQNISTDRMSLPYKKDGNKVTIDFGKTVVQNIEIKIPREANLSVLLVDGNVAVDTIQGRVAIALTNGTIAVKNFAPLGTNALETKSGTIDVTLADKTSCSIKAKTNFGAIVSSYSALSKKRSDMKDEASGKIGNGSGASVNLTAGYGSITLKPV